jgi:aminoglycoside phosphotransferase family enzyme/predicted kinase
MAFAEIVDFLSNPATHGARTRVETVRTHAAIVFLAGDAAYKVKRPVTYEYLDFSTPEKRAAMLRRELELNRPSAPEIYRGLVPVTRQADGGLALGGDGEPVEWCLHMRRFPAGAEMTAVAARGGIDRDLAEAIGAAIAEYHARAETRPEDGRDLVSAVAADLDAAFAGMTDPFGKARVETFHARVATAIDANAALLSGRGRAGHVRRGHGDLHLGNMVLLDGRPVLFDALEFDERLATLDVLYDLAFAIMDLLHRGLPEAAHAVLGAYLRCARVPDHLDGLALLPLFMGLRAGIRAMVTVQAAGLGDGAPASEIEGATAYLDHALGCLAPPAPRLVAVGGYSGTGKTTLARHLAPLLAPVPGAIHLRSDVERKAMFGVDPLVRLPQEAYSEAAGRRVYARLLDRADRILRAGHSVILDAVFARADEREALAGLARGRGVRFDGLWLEADRGTLISRVAARRGDASDADAAVVRRQLASGSAARGWPRLDAGGCAQTVLRHARDTLGL